MATSGRVGSDGSILLLEIGRIEAAGNPKRHTSRSPERSHTRQLEPALPIGNH